jgi:hypothetical protein
MEGLVGGWVFTNRLLAHRLLALQRAIARASSRRRDADAAASLRIGDIATPGDGTETHLPTDRSPAS